MATNIEDTLSEILTQIQRNGRQSRDGSHLNIDNINKEFDKTFKELLNNLAGTAKRIPSQNDIRREVGEFKQNLERFNVDQSDVTKMVSKYKKDLDAQRKKEIDSLKNYTSDIEKAREEAIVAAKKEASSNIFSTLSNGKTDRIARTGEEISTFGESLNLLSGGSGILGKTGQAFVKFGKILGGPYVKAFVASLYVAKLAVDTFAEALAAISEHEIKELGFDKSLLTAENEFKKQLINFNKEEQQEKIDYAFELLKRNFEVESEIAKTARQLSADNYVKAVKIGMGSITDGISQSAYQAASAAIDAGTATLINFQKADTSRLKAEELNKARRVKYDSTLENIANNLEVASRTNENAIESINQERSYYEAENRGKTNWQKETGGKLINGDSVIGKPNDDPTKNSSKYHESNIQSRYSANGEGNGGYLSGAAAWAKGGVESAWYNMWGQEAYHKMQMADADLTRYKFQSSKEITALEIQSKNEIKNLEASNEAEMFGIKKDYAQSLYEIDANAAKENAKAYLELANKQLQFVGEMMKKTNYMAINAGANTQDQIRKFQEAWNHRLPELFRKWGKSLDDIINIQTSYGEQTGRAINLSNQDIEKSLGLTMLTNDQNITNELNAGTQMFAMSVSDSSQMFGEILDTARAIGLDMKTMGKNLVRDMKLANKYEFKGGLKSLAKMSEWATKVRFDMSNLPSLIDKFTNGLESSITTAASMQVLGGNFAQYSDPLRNAYLGYMDPSELAKNMNSALKGIGYFNDAEGKTKIGIADQERLKAFSNATGISMESLRAQVTQMIQGNKVLGALTNENFEKYTDKQKELLQQQAFMQDGEWKVTLRNGETKNINDISQEDFSDLLPTEEAMLNLTKEGVEYLKQLVDVKSLQEGEENAEKIDLIQEKMDSYYNTFEEMTAEALINFKNRKAEYQDYIDQNLKLMITSYKGYCEMAAKGDEQIDTQMKNIIKNANNIVTTLESVNQMFVDAQQRIRESEEIYQETDTSSGISTVPNTYHTEQNDSTIVAAPVGGGGGKAWDGLINKNGLLNRINDGLVIQNGVPTRIDNNDQVLAAKNGGPLDRMLDTVLQPRPLKYDSFVKENPYGSNSSGGNGKIEIAPIQISINGNIQINGANGTMDITQQIANDPNFIRSISQMISLEVEKKVNGGKVNSPLNRGLSYT